MTENTLDITLTSLLKYLSRVYHRSCGGTVASADKAFFKLLAKAPSLEAAAAIMQNAPQKNKESAVCSLAFEIAAPKEIFRAKNFGEVDGSQLSALYSVFDRLNTVKGQKSESSVLVYNSERKAFVRKSAAEHRGFDYSAGWAALEKKLNSLSQENASVEKYLRMIRELCSDMPLANDPALLCDLSLYDYARLSAAFAGAMSEYIAANDTTADLRSEKAFLLYSADFTCIQNFIYTVTESDALKTLRAKSFFVELVMEHLIDEIIDMCGVSRANLLYSGGGHCYVILPNTPGCIDKLAALHKKVNLWAAKAFGNVMCVVWDVRECSANDFLDEPRGSYAKMFTGLSSQLAVRKLQKYTPDELLALNAEIADHKDRECSICGKASSLVHSGDGNRYCEWCSGFVEMSKTIMNENMCFAILKKKTIMGQVRLFSADGEAYLAFMSEKRIADEYSAGNVKRIYCKNTPGDMDKYNESRVIFVCDHQDDKILENLAASADGVKRLGVLRMDVDNLGKTFVSGFRIKDELAGGFCEKESFVSIARTAALSYQLSVFFKQSLKTIFVENELSVNVIYSGGDDVFLVGAWNDVISAAQKIVAGLTELSGGKLTASAGIGIYDSKYPIAAYAVETEALESCAKHNPGKASITLFEADQRSTYSWSLFAEKVQGEKLALLYKFLKTDDNGKGMTFVYNLLGYLRGCADDRINIARVAYLLGRMCSEKGLVNKNNAKAFSGKIYDWVTNDIDRQQLITAICIYVYSERKDIHHG